MHEHVEIRHGSYHDSVTLMLVSKQLAARDDVEIASIGAGTPLNVELVTGQGFTVPASVTPNDLIIALRLADESAVPVALTTIEELLRPPRDDGGDGRQEAPPVSLRAAARRHREANLAVLSVPRQALEYEIAAALDERLNVFCFSDGLSLEAERRYKERAVSEGLLLMGPDCGTAILDGVGLGFANAVRPGPVGIVGASGTGIQEVTCLLDRAGVGVSQVYGVGGRDLKADIGAVMTLEVIRRLARDPATQTLLVISKPPADEVAARVAAAVSACGLPAALCFLGSRQTQIDGVPVLATLEEAARWASSIHAGSWPEQDVAVATPTRVSGDLHGLFSGGTLAYEAMTTMVDQLAPILSNTPLDPAWRLLDPLTPEGNCVVDFGEDDLTEGRAHPMIDPTLRLASLDASAADPRVGVILMDLVLGQGAHPDPAEELAAHVATALATRPADLAVVVSVCGTDHDPQGAQQQAARLRAAGAYVTWSAASAARLALRLLGRDR